MVAKDLRVITFKEERRVVNILDEVVREKGIDRSDFIREAIRSRLANLSFFSEDAKKALGVLEKGSNGSERTHLS